MLETTNELVTQIRASLGGSQKGKTTNEIVAEIRDAIANGISGGGISEEDVRDIIAEIIDGAPEAFDTFKEIQDYLDTIYTKGDVDAALANKANTSEITTEAAARQSADTTLQNNITKEIADRQADISDVKSQLRAALIINEASGAVATFSDGADGYPMRSVTVALEPIQDLHGQDAPYPGGGEKNLCPIATMDTTSGGNINASCGAVGTVEAGVTYTFSLVNKTTSTANLHVRMVIDGEYSDVASGNLISGGSKSYTFTPTVSGEVTLNASIGSVYSPAFENLQLEKGSTATAYAPYSNICPISGRSEVKVWRSGKNLLDPADAEIGIAWNGASNTARARLVVSIMPNTDYVLSMNGTNSLDGIYKTLSAVMPPTGIEPLTTPFNFNSGNNKYLVLGFTKANIAQSDIDALKLQLELGSTATAYEAPSIQTITVQLGQTVYGGTVDAASGVMTVDMARVDLRTGNWEARSDAVGRYFARSISPKGVVSIEENICSLYKTVSSSNVPDGCIAMAYSGYAIYVRDSRYDTVSDFITGVNGQSFVYRLAEPVTVQLTAQQLTTLLGTNNVWSNADSVSVEYAINTKTYIDDTIQNSTIQSNAVRNIVVLTQAQYDALTTKDANTEYNIIGE